MADIGIFTIVALDNFGAILQGYALQRKLSDMGQSAELVDLRNSEQSDCRIFKKVKSPLDILRNARQLLSYRKTKRRFDLFNKFVAENIVLSENYNTEDSLKSLPYKLLMTGSDQTFNIKLPVFKKEYYLGFEKNIQKVSYASSFGEFCSRFTDAEKSKIKEWLSDYRYIGIREEQGVEFAKEITGREDIVRNVDPTLLLTENEWEELAVGDNKYGDYIAFYSVLSDKWVVDEVQRIAKELNLKVIALHMCNQFEIGAGFERVSAGPGEFLSIIKNAKLVLTTSFHASVFAITFHKPFYSFVLEEGNRIRNLLNMTGLQDRLIASVGKTVSVDEVDFSEADEKIKNERDKSIEYLEKVIELID